MALSGLKYEDDQVEKNNRMKNELSIPLLLNIAQALIKQDKFGNAIIICNKVAPDPHPLTTPPPLEPPFQPQPQPQQALEQDMTNAKTLCKRGQAYMYNRDYDNAEMDLVSSLKLSRDNPEQINDIRRFLEQLKELKRKE